MHVSNNSMWRVILMCCSLYVCKQLHHPFASSWILIWIPPLRTLQKVLLSPSDQLGTSMREGSNLWHISEIPRLHRGEWRQRASWFLTCVSKADMQGTDDAGLRLLLVRTLGRLPPAVNVLHVNTNQQLVQQLFDTKTKIVSAIVLSIGNLC